MVGMAEFKAYCTEHDALIACDIQLKTGVKTDPWDFFL
jgi:hypothetical protein